MFQMTYSMPNQSKGGTQHDNPNGTKCTSKKTKEPRFVPYEPYKAAVTPFVASKNRGRLCRVQQSTTTKANHPLSKKKLKESLNRRSSSNTGQGQENKALPDHECNANVRINDNVKDTSNLESFGKDEDDMQAEARNLSKQLLAKDKLLEELQKKLAESEKQLRIQIQVSLWVRTRDGPTDKGGHII